MDNYASVPFRYLCPEFFQIFCMVQEPLVFFQVFKLRNESNLFNFSGAYV